MTGTTGLRRLRIVLPALLIAVLIARAEPTVTITAPDPDATEAGYFPGLFRVERTGPDFSQALAVGLVWTGTATCGRDYEPTPTAALIPAGTSAVEVALLPINDGDFEALPTETVVCAISPGTNYVAGSPGTATVFLADNETFTNTAVLHYLARADSSNAVTVFWTDNFETESKYRVQYRLEATSSWSSIDVSSNTTSRLITGLLPGQAYEFRVTAYASNGTTAALTQNSMRQVTIAATSGPPFATFEEWRIAKGLTGDLRATASRTDDDPDGDRVANLFEYLLGSDPLVPGQTGLALAAAGGGLQLQWPANTNLVDASLVLQEATAPTNWMASPLSGSLTNGIRTALDVRADAQRQYRLVAAVPGRIDPAPLITCWGDSLTAYATGYPLMLSTTLARNVQNCGIGGDTSVQIADRLRGLTITSPYPPTGTNTPAGTPVRIVASRTAHSRIMNSANRSSWAVYSATIANVSRVEFFNRGAKIGETTSPLAATVTSDRLTNPSRLIAPGHPFAYGDIVHFPAGPVPAPLVTNKTYYVRDVDTNGFALAEEDTFVSLVKTNSATRFIATNHPFAAGSAVFFPATPLPSPLIVGRTYYVRDTDPDGFALAETNGGTAITVTSDLSGMVIKGPVRAALTLTQDFAAPTRVQGPFVFDSTHPGGTTLLSLRTHTDRDANTFVFWMGRNNSSRPHEVYADLHASIEHIKALNGRFLILGVLTASTEMAGNAYYYNAINLNNLLRREFPDQFIDIRRELILAGQPSGQDLIDRQSDVTPTSLRSDTLHLNDAGYQVVAAALARELLGHGW